MFSYTEKKMKRLFLSWRQLSLYSSFTDPSICPLTSVVEGEWRSAHFYAAWCITKMAKSTVVKLASECLFSVSQNIHVHNRHCLKQIVLKFVISYYSEVYYSILFFMEATSPLRLSSSGYYQRWHCEHISYISITLFINYLLIKCIKC